MFSMVYNWVYVTEATASISDHTKLQLRPSDLSEGFFLQHLFGFFVNYCMAIIKTKELFIVAAKYMFTDVNMFFTTTEEAETWRTDAKNISVKLQYLYSVMTYDEWLELVKEDAYSSGRNDGAEMGNEI